MFLKDAKREQMFHLPVGYANRLSYHITKE